MALNPVQLIETCLKMQCKNADKEDAGFISISATFNQPHKDILLQVDGCFINLTIEECTAIRDGLSRIIDA